MAGDAPVRRAPVVQDRVVEAAGGDGATRLGRDGRGRVATTRATGGVPEGTHARVHHRALLDEVTHVRLVVVRRGREGGRRERVIVVAARGCPRLVHGRGPLAGRGASVEHRLTSRVGRETCSGLRATTTERSRARREVARARGEMARVEARFGGTHNRAFFHPLPRAGPRRPEPLTTSGARFEMRSLGTPSRAKG